MCNYFSFSNSSLFSPLLHFLHLLPLFSYLFLSSPLSPFIILSSLTPFSSSILFFLHLLYHPLSSLLFCHLLSLLLLYFQHTIDAQAPRALAISTPLKVTITNWEQGPFIDLSVSYVCLLVYLPYYLFFFVVTFICLSLYMCMCVCFLLQPIFNNPPHGRNKSHFCISSFDISRILQYVA